MGNEIVHLEILSQDLQAAKDFFGKLFGWKFQQMGDNYTLFQTDAEGGLQGGGFGTDDSGQKQKAIAYIMVDDIDAKLKEITAAGGSTIMPKTALPEDYGSIALFSDPHGVHWGLYSE